jgi:hypothetical protein
MTVNRYGATLLLAAFFALALFAGRWEQGKFHRGRLTELVRMRDELGEESPLGLHLFRLFTAFLNRSNGGL